MLINKLLFSLFFSKVLVHTFKLKTLLKAGRIWFSDLILIKRIEMHQVYSCSWSVIKKGTNFPSKE